MMRYLVQHRDRKFVKSYWYLSFTKNMGKNIGENVIKKLKLSQKDLSKKTAEPIGDFIGNKITERVAKSYDGKITKISKISQQNYSETVTNEHDKELPKRDIYLQKKGKKNIDDIRLI